MGGGDEPEVRRALRQRRIQEKHERMQRQVRGPSWGCRAGGWVGGANAARAGRGHLAPLLRWLIAHLPPAPPAPMPCRAQLAEARARDEAEVAEKEGKVELRGTLKPKIDAWAAGKKVGGERMQRGRASAAGAGCRARWRRCVRRLQRRPPTLFPRLARGLCRTTSARCWPACTRCCGRAPAGRRPAWQTWLRMPR